jgi:hypothetical protein
MSLLTFWTKRLLRRRFRMTLLKRTKRAAALIAPAAPAPTATMRCREYGAR